MPITLEKLFSPTDTRELPFLGETVHVTWAPFRYTGEMQEFAERLLDENTDDRAGIEALRERVAKAREEAIALAGEEEPDTARINELLAEAGKAEAEIGTRQVKLDWRDKQGIREVLAKLLVAWDVLDEKGKPIPTDVATLNTLPDTFLLAVFGSMQRESVPDPSKAPPSNEPSPTAMEPVREISAPSPAGTRSSSLRARSASPRSSSTSGPTDHATIPPGGIG